MKNYNIDATYFATGLFLCVMGIIFLFIAVFTGADLTNFEDYINYSAQTVVLSVAITGLCAIFGIATLLFAFERIDND